jgi:signal transduction histidine kinase
LLNTRACGTAPKAQEEERLRISRELHDDVGGRIALLVCSVRRFVADLSEKSHKIEPELRGTIQGLIDLAASLRNISHALLLSFMSALGQR